MFSGKKREFIIFEFALFLNIFVTLVFILFEFSISNNECLKKLT